MNNQAFGWVMQAASTSGGKVYQIAFVDDILIVGWGSRQASTRQYKVTKHASHSAARQAAIEATQEKERKGYVLTVQPRAYVICGQALLDLRRMVGHRGASALIKFTFEDLMRDGELIAP